MLPEFVALSDGNEHGMVARRKFRFPAGSIVTFDKGCVDYKWFASFTGQEVCFVTRLRIKTVYKVLERGVVNKDKDITSDKVIQLNGVHALKFGAPKLRRVGFVGRKGGQIHALLTNDFSL